jgi:hypothetical protein
LQTDVKTLYVTSSGRITDSVNLYNLDRLSSGTGEAGTLKGVRITRYLEQPKDIGVRFDMRGRGPLSDISTIYSKDVALPPPGSFVGTGRPIPSPEGVPVLDLKPTGGEIEFLGIPRNVAEQFQLFSGTGVSDRLAAPLATTVFGAYEFPNPYKVYPYQGPFDYTAGDRFRVDVGGGQMQLLKTPDISDVAPSPTEVLAESRTPLVTTSVTKWLQQIPSTYEFIPAVAGAAYVGAGARPGLEASALPSTSVIPAVQPVSELLPVAAPLTSTAPSLITQPVIGTATIPSMQVIPATEAIAQPSIEVVPQTQVVPKITTSIVPALSAVPYIAPGAVFTPAYAPGIPSSPSGSKKKSKEIPLLGQFGERLKRGKAVVTPDLFTATVSQAAFGKATKPRFKKKDIELLRQRSFIRVPTKEFYAPGAVDSGAVLKRLIG